VLVKRDDRLWVAKALFNNSLSVGNCFVYSVFRGVGKSFCDIPQSVGKKALRPAGQPRKPGAKKFPHLFISLHLILSLPVYWALRVQRISDLAAGQSPSPAGQWALWPAGHSGRRAAVVRCPAAAPPRLCCVEPCRPPPHPTCVKLRRPSPPRPGCVRRAPPTLEGGSVNVFNDCRRVSWILTVGASDLWARLGVRCAPDMHCSLSGAPVWARLTPARAARAINAPQVAVGAD
jgi:hypothetical protein